MHINTAIYTMYLIINIHIVIVMHNPMYLVQ